MWLQSFQRVLHRNDNLEASWWCIQRSREDTDAPKQIPRDIKCAGVHPDDKCRKISKEIHWEGGKKSIDLLRRMTCTFGFSSVFVRVRRQRSSRKWKKNINLILAPLKQGALKILIEIYFFRRLISFQTINLVAQCPMSDYVTIVPTIAMSPLSRTMYIVSKSLSKQLHAHHFYLN